MKHVLVILCIGLSLVVTSRALDAKEPASTIQTRLSAADYFDLRFAADPRIAPDGESVVFVEIRNDQASDRLLAGLRFVATAGGATRKLTDGPWLDWEPRLLPDGRHVVFLSDRSGSTQIHRLRLADRSVEQISRLDHEPRGLAVSPDGQRVAYLARVPEPGEVLAELPPPPLGVAAVPAPRVIDRLFDSGLQAKGSWQLFVLDPRTGTSTQVSSGESEHWGGDRFDPHRDAGAPTWSPDGRWLYAAVDRRERRRRETSPRNLDIWAFTVDGGEHRRLTSRRGPDFAPIVSPDGKWIAYLGYDEAARGYQQADLWVMASDGSGARRLSTGIDRDLRSPRWAHDGRGIFVLFHDRGDTHIGLVTLDGELRRLSGGLGDGFGTYGTGSFTVARDDRHAFVVTGPEVVAEVAMASLDEPVPRRLTSLSSAVLARRELGRFEAVSVTSTDGTVLDGWLLRPPASLSADPDAERFPLILEIHGGPFREYGARFDFEKQLWAARGYAVLYINQRGSAGYGADFGNAIDRRFPSRAEVDDLLAAVDTMIDRGVARADDLCVVGGSGGGLLALWLTTVTDRFDAAVSHFPVVNWTSLALTSDIGRRVIDEWFGVMPWEDPEAYWRRSPLSRVDRVATPTLLMTGEADRRTPVAETEQYFAALKLRGVDSRMVRVPEGTHGLFQRPSHYLTKALYSLAWCDRYRSVSGSPVAEGIEEAEGVEGATP
ncbi:MAG: prolyl oligopeptidase family serine peptidase [Acidobacteriota bacterium]